MAKGSSDEPPPKAPLKEMAKKNAKKKKTTKDASNLISPMSHKVIALLFPVLPLVLLVFFLKSECGAPPAPVCVDPSVKGVKGVATFDPVQDAPLLCRASWSLWETQPADECYVSEGSKKKRRGFRNPIKALVSKLQKRRQNRRARAQGDGKLGVKDFQNAYTVPPKDGEQPQQHDDLMNRLSNKVKDTVPDFHERAARVPWAGSQPWWGYSNQGRELLGSYLKIMKYPEDLLTNFPFKLCSAKGCQAEVAIAHTLEWREKFRPWLVSPSGMAENVVGYVYHRGHCHTVDGGYGHSMVWIRAGLVGPKDATLFFRNILHTLDRAVGDCLQRSGGRVGKFNVVFDNQGFGLHLISPFGAIRRSIIMLQDHFPDRLGMIFVVNLSKPAELVLNFVKQLITKEVREKIVVVPSDPEKRREIFEAVVLQEYIPDYLGGEDTYRMDLKQYYPRQLHCTDEEAIEYVTTMPYHA